MMEKSQIFLQESFKSIIETISVLKIDYKFNNCYNEHLIRVYPEDEYKNNLHYKELEANLIFDFIDRFPNESLVFINDDEWLNIEKPDNSFKGDNFESMWLDFYCEDSFVFDNDIFDFNLESSEILNGLEPIIRIKFPIVGINEENISQTDNFALAA